MSRTMAQAYNYPTQSHHLLTPSHPPTNTYDTLLAEQEPASVIMTSTVWGQAVCTMRPAPSHDQMGNYHDAAGHYKQIQKSDLCTLCTATRHSWSCRAAEKVGLPLPAQKSVLPHSQK